MLRDLPRRRFVLQAGMLLASGLAPRTAHLQHTTAPLPSSLREGDLVFPRPHGRIVLFGDGAISHEEEEWRRQRGKYLEGLRKRTSLSKEETAWGVKLERMTYEECRRFFEGDVQTKGIQEFGSSAPGPVYIGHVGIIQLEGGQPYVIEAVPKAVRIIRYEDWLSNAGSEVWVWHATLSGPVLSDPKMRSAILRVARSFVGSTYDLWNFDLSDRGSFYCSKLVWLSIKEATGIAIDNNNNAKRYGWISPLGIACQSERLRMIFRPNSDEYGRC
jgi:uncharacterized protein YycO